MVNLVLVILWTITFTLWCSILIDSIRQKRKVLIILNTILIVFSFFLMCFYAGRVRDEIKIEQTNLVEVTVDGTT